MGPLNRRMIIHVKRRNKSAPDPAVSPFSAVASHYFAISVARPLRCYSKLDITAVKHSRSCCVYFDGRFCLLPNLQPRAEGEGGNQLVLAQLPALPLFS